MLRNLTSLEDEQSFLRNLATEMAIIHAEYAKPIVFSHAKCSQQEFNAEISAYYNEILKHPSKFAAMYNHTTLADTIVASQVSINSIITEKYSEDILTLFQKYNPTIDDLNQLAYMASNNR